MTADVVELAYKGEWPELLRHLESQPHLVNSISAKGYTPLHQAAWHGAGSVALLIKRRKLAENGAAPLTLDGPLLPSQKIGRRTTSWVFRANVTGHSGRT